QEAIPWFEAGAGRTQGGEILRHAREREIADRDDVCAGIARPRVAAAIAEGVELLHVADRKAGLGLDPGAQPDFAGAMRQRVGRHEREPRAGLAPGGVAGHQNGRFLGLHRHDRGGEPDLDRRERGFGHGASVARALDVGAWETCQGAQDSTHSNDAAPQWQQEALYSIASYDAQTRGQVVVDPFCGLKITSSNLAAARPPARRAWRRGGSCRDRSRPDGAAGARSAKRKALGGGSILPRASSSQELWGALDYQNL